MLSFSIHYTQYLSARGEPEGPLPDWAADTGRLAQFYRDMVLARTLDKKCIALQRTGQLGTYPSCLGQEAIGVGLARAMGADDVFVPYYRDLPAQLVRGVRIEELLLYWGGDERGCDFSLPREDFPPCVPIATQSLHATGVATAIKIRHQKRAVVTTIGDGGTSKADFLDALNVAGAWQLPVVFVINNNQWAISVPRRVQCGAPTLAQKGIGAGLPSEQVDGNDVVAVHDAVRRALARARAGKGATVIEAISYRLSDHTTADDATRYRPREELAEAWEREPVKRLRDYLHARSAWSEALETEWLAECQGRIEAAVRAYLATPPAAPESIFEHLFSALPARLEPQLEHIGGKGGTHHG